MTISEALNQSLMDLEASVQWRSMKSEEYPDDKRNEQAAALLERLTSEIASAGDVALTDELARLEAQLLDLDDVSHLQNATYECSECRRRIGFHEFPTTGEEYLRHLVHIYSSHLSLARSNLQSSSGKAERLVESSGARDACGCSSLSHVPSGHDRADQLSVMLATTLPAAGSPAHRQGCQCSLQRIPQAPLPQAEAVGAGLHVQMTPVPDHGETTYKGLRPAQRQAGRHHRR
jgi:hypothetical protein